MQRLVALPSQVASCITSIGGASQRSNWTPDENEGLTSGTGRGLPKQPDWRDRWVTKLVRDEAVKRCGAAPGLVAAHGARPGNMSGLQSGSPQLRSGQKTAVM